MDIVIYAIKVGTSSIDKLDLNSELDIDSAYTVKDNPSYSKEDKPKTSDSTAKPLNVYDVLLAGVESND